MDLKTTSGIRPENDNVLSLMFCVDRFGHRCCLRCNRLQANADCRITDDDDQHRNDCSAHDSSNPVLRVHPVHSPCDTKKQHSIDQDFGQYDGGLIDPSAGFARNPNHEKNLNDEIREKNSQSEPRCVSPRTGSAGSRASLDGFRIGTPTAR